MNYSKFLSPTSLARKPSAIRILTAIALQAGPSMISLAGGMPNAATFPFKEASFKMWNGDTLHFNEDRMKAALQYSASSGIPDFVDSLCKMQKHWHSGCHHFSPSNICVTHGSTDGLSKSLEMLLNAGDGILLEQPTTPDLIATLKPLGCSILPIATDRDGLIPSDIINAFEGFEASTNKRNKNLNSSEAGRIKCLYTSASLSSTCTQRRREVLELAKEKDFLVLEHDPFFFLTQDKTESYLSLDVEERVLRFDSLSNIFSPGMRIGVVSGPEELVKRVVLHVMVSTMHCPSISQMMVNEVMDHMGIEGFNNFCQILYDHYQARRHLALKAADHHLSEFFDWETPKFGYGLCLRPKETRKADIPQVLRDLEEQNVYFRNGKDCYVEENQKDEILISFGLCEEENIEKGCELLAISMKERSS